MFIIIAPGETDAGKRAVEFLLIGTDGMPLAADKSGEQPQVSIDGGVFANTGIGVLALASGNRYLATLTTGVLVEGRTIRTRFADGDTVECWGDTVQVGVAATAASVEAGARSAFASWECTFSEDNATAVHVPVNEVAPDDTFNGQTLRFVTGNIAGTTRRIIRNVVNSAPLTNTVFVVDRALPTLPTEPSQIEVIPTQTGGLLSPCRQGVVAGEGLESVGPTADWFIASWDQYPDVGYDPASGSFVNCIVCVYPTDEATDTGETTQVRKIIGYDAATFKMTVRPPFDPVPPDTRYRFTIYRLPFAVEGDQADLVDAPNAAAVTAIQDGLALEATLTAIKGEGWTVETLKALYDAVALLLPNAEPTGFPVTVTVTLGGVGVLGAGGEREGLVDLLQRCHADRAAGPMDHLNRAIEQLTQAAHGLRDGMRSLQTAA